MTDGRLEMTALITATPGKEAELKARLKEVVAETNKESGCIEFRIFEDLENPGRFVLWEVFESQAALRLHVNMEYTRAYFASGLAARTQVFKLRSF